ncbi:MAG: ABC transporter ATP-binding protein [Deltaproteobacteria bacterium]|nr:ABC transporter ATP-binding protein [Deltaproteobacteria bacterium]
MKDSSFLAIENLDKRFGSLHVLKKIALEVAEGEILALLGPSGSGKTTALRLLAGFETPDSGSIRVGGEEVSRLPAARRGFGMVFQHYALFPHLTVGQNVAFGLETRNWKEAEIQQRVAAMLALVDLADFEGRRLGEISGGQQQRVALARALAPEPRLLLLDEPLSNLDPTLRERTRRQLRQAIERIGITTILVTHEQEEAFHLGDRVAVLHGGELQQVGRPEELYEHPRTRFVASFVGRSSVVSGHLESVDGSLGRVAIAGTDCIWEGHLVEGGRPGDEVEVRVRPESLVFAAEPAPGVISAEVVERRYGGAMTLYFLQTPKCEETPGPMKLEVMARGNAARAGEVVGVRLGETGPLPTIFPIEPGATI